MDAGMVLQESNGRCVVSRNGRQVVASEEGNGEQRGVPSDADTEAAFELGM